MPNTPPPVPPLAADSHDPAGTTPRNEYTVDELARVTDTTVRNVRAYQDRGLLAPPFHLVGHDWGSIQSWETVTDPAFKGRIVSYTSISGPCLDHASFGLRGESESESEGDDNTQTAHPITKPPFGSSVRQTLKSWYIFFFHLPWLPKLMWRAGGACLWPLWLRVTERVRPAPDPAQMRNAINGLNLYRANFIDKLLRPRARHAHAPVQFIVPLREPLRRAAALARTGVLAGRI
jgi:hypothetical protein